MIKKVRSYREKPCVNEVNALFLRYWSFI